MKNIAIIDYGCGNILSLKRALSKIGYNSDLTRDSDKISKATHLILPGVGAFGNAMELLKKYNLLSSIKSHGNDGKPLLGICLGMQLLLSNSYEFGKHEGLNLIEGSVEKISDQTKKKIKIPHIGWNKIKFNYMAKEYKKFDGKNFYFVHSFIAKTTNSKNTIAYSNFSNLKIPSIIKRNNVTGFQFHPEKSHTDGLSLIKHFCDSDL